MHFNVSERTLSNCSAEIAGVPAGYQVTFNEVRIKELPMEAFGSATAA